MTPKKRLNHDMTDCLN